MLASGCLLASLCPYDQAGSPINSKWGMAAAAMRVLLTFWHSFYRYRARRHRNVAFACWISETRTVANRNLTLLDFRPRAQEFWLLNLPLSTVSNHKQRSH